MFDKKLIATAIIWIAVTITVENLTVTTASSKIDPTAVVAIMVISALLATAAIWISDAIGKYFQYRNQSEDIAREKPKHQERLESSGDTRIQLLLQLLDEHEKAAIKSRLLNDVEAGADGEISLDMLLSEFESER